jgi:hypothetical protein
VARTYAGILGPLALVTSLAHGSIHAMEAQAILLAAWSSLLVFAAVGGIVGWVAGSIVEESVAATIRAELAREETGSRPPGAPPA